MDTEFFVENKMNIVFEMIDRNFFNAISSGLDKVERNVATLITEYEQVCLAVTFSYPIYLNVSINFFSNGHYEFAFTYQFSENYQS